MAEAVFSDNLCVINAMNFKDKVSATDVNLYFTHGRVTPWANDAAPVQANTSVVFLNEVWNNMIGAKLLTGNDVRLGIRRNNYEANVSYPHYDSAWTTEQIFDSNNKFFVVTSDWNVYKCISNNSGGISSVMPTHLQTTNPVEEVDGYVWKYMYSIGASGQYRFITENFIPVMILENDNGSLQWQVMQNAVEGAVMAYKVVDGGSGYTSNTLSLTIVGDGINANAFARVNTVSGQIANVVVTNKGVGYSYANVTVTSPGDGSGAVFEPMIAPSGGHGNDPVRELGGGYVIINTRLRYDETDKFPVGNDFRQVAIIQNPELYGTQNVASSTAYSQFLTVILNSGVTVFEKDETVFQGDNLATATFKGKVLSYELIESNYVLKLIDTVGTITVDVITGATSGTSRFVESITNPQLKKYSGKLIYAHNIVPITRASDQIEDFKIVLKF